MYFYKQTERTLWTVGCEVNGEWIPDSDHDSPGLAAKRVNFLNGGPGVSTIDEITGIADFLRQKREATIDGQILNDAIRLAVEDLDKLISKL